MQLLNRVQKRSVSGRGSHASIARLGDYEEIETSGAHHSQAFQNDSQTMQEANVCDDLGSEYSSKIPLLVELRTDKAGITRYRALSLGGTDMEPQWVSIPNPHAGATGWLQAENFTKMDFQPPLQPALTLVRRLTSPTRPPTRATRRRRGNLTRSIWLLLRNLEPSTGTVACIVTPLCTSCRAIRPRSSRKLVSEARWLRVATLPEIAAPSSRIRSSEKYQISGKQKTANTAIGKDHAGWF